MNVERFGGACEYDIKLSLLTHTHMGMGMRIVCWYVFNVLCTVM